MQASRWPSLAQLLFTGLAAFVVHAWWQHQSAEDPVVDHTRLQQEQFGRMALPQAAAHCHALWLQRHWDQAPLALAWHPGRLDWYVLAGIDETSMRHFSCNAAAVERGARYARVLPQRVPPGGTQGRNVLRDLNLFTHYAKTAVDPELRALEAVHDLNDPTAAVPIERRWGKDGRARWTGPAVAELAQLFAQPVTGLVDPPAALARLTPTDWLKQPQAVFALLGDHVPAESRIARLSIGSDSITVTVRGQIKNFDGKPPAAFGDASFDEYGVRDASWWYPRDNATHGCTIGHTLAELRQQYLAHQHANHPKLLSAQYGCSGKGQAPTLGSWALHLPRRR